MELKEYYLIIKKHQRLFFALIIFTILTSALYFFSLPTSFETSLFLNITRSGNQVSDSYKYDDFYRLQADEKFAETVVQWLKSPRIVSDIISEAGRNFSDLSLKKLTKIFQAEKLSSQVVSVRFSTPDRKTAEKTALAISSVLKINTEQLNEDQKENTWFEIKADDPFIIEQRTDYVLVFLVALLGGLFVGFWFVILKHYLE